MKTKNGFIKANILIVIILCLIIIACILYVFHKKALAPIQITIPPATNTYGMSEYNDPHGFTFWYPNALQITSTIINDNTSFPGGIAVESLQIGEAGGTTIFVVNSGAGTITDEPTGHASPIAQTEYFYDNNSGQWMVKFPEGGDTGNSATTAADVSKTTISGLPMLPSGRRFDSTIIPLNTTRFIVIGDGGGSSFTSELAKTIAQTGTQIDSTIQSSALLTESAAYTSGTTNVTSESTIPTIVSLTPTSGVVGTSVTISGSGFTEAGNKIKFGDLGIENNPKYIFNSPDGKTITFTVPLSNFLICWASGCKDPAYLTHPGDYQISVINDNGASNQMTFTVTKTDTQPVTQ